MNKEINACDLQTGDTIKGQSNPVEHIYPKDGDKVAYRTITTYGSFRNSKRIEVEKK